MLGVALAAVQATLLLTVAVVGMALGQPARSIFQAVAVTWVAAPAVALLVAGARHQRASAAAGSATRAADEERRPAVRVLAEVHGPRGR